MQSLILCGSTKRRNLRITNSTEKEKENVVWTQKSNENKKRDQQFK